MTTTPAVISFAYKNYEVEGKTRNAICIKCGAKVTDGIATTSNFNRHLQRTHKYVSLSNHFACTVVAQPLVRSKNKNNLFLLAKTKTVLWSWKPTLRVGTLWAPHLTSKIDLFWPENILPKGKICGVTKKSGEIFSFLSKNKKCILDLQIQIVKNAHDLCKYLHITEGLWLLYDLFLTWKKR